MRIDKNLALKLRLQGNSYGQIEKRLGVPKSTLSSWLSKLEISDGLTQRIRANGRKKSIAALIARNQKQTNLAIQRAYNTKSQSKKLVGTLNRRDIFIAGVALYWAEGYKKQKTNKGRLITSHSVSLTNSDPKLVGMFLRFLREFCGVRESQLRASLRIFPHQNEKRLVDYWVKSTNIDRSAFGKTYVGQSPASKNIRPFNQLPYGVIQIRVNDTPLYNRIMGFIDGLANLS
jgi:DNA-binding transcriptional ArsR family regulator